VCIRRWTYTTTKYKHEAAKRGHIFDEWRPWESCIPLSLYMPTMMMMMTFNTIIYYYYYASACVCVMCAHTPPFVLYIYIIYIVIYYTLYVYPIVYTCDVVAAAAIAVASEPILISRAYRMYLFGRSSSLHVI